MKYIKDKEEARAIMSQQMKRSQYKEFRSIVL